MHGHTNIKYIVVNTSWDSAVDITTTIRPGRSGILIPARETFLFSENPRPALRSPQTSLHLVPGFCREGKAFGARQPSAKLRMSGAILLNRNIQFYSLTQLYYIKYN